MELNENEAELINRIRSQFRYCRIMVVTDHGVPQYIEETITRYSLSPEKKR